MSIKQEDMKRYLLTIVFSDGITDLFYCSHIPSVGDEVAIHHENGSEEVVRINRVRLKTYWIGMNLDSYVDDSDAMLWVERVSLKPG